MDRTANWCSHGGWFTLALYLNIAKFVKMIFWKNFTTSLHSFFFEGGQLSISVLQFGQFCTNVSPTNNAKLFFLR
jgi:hypothetical protein